MLRLTIIPNLCFCLVLLVPQLCFSQRAPSFEPAAVVASDLNQPVPLAPGLLMSIYGEHLGPPAGCQGYGDRDELCNAQVLVNGVRASLLYVQERQINFKMPNETPAEGVVDIQVVYNGQASSPAKLRASRDRALISLVTPAAVGGPVWLKVSIAGMPQAVRYPYQIYPANFGCDEVEVRRDGKLLPRIAGGFSQALDGISIGGGNPCSSIGLPSEPKHVGRLPLHLQYRFDQPGTYEVRFTMRRSFNPAAPAMVRSAWTPIEILPGTPAEQRSVRAPSDSVELLTDYLPNILGIPDPLALELLRPYLYHPDRLVREFAMYGLTYWPAEQAETAILEAFRSRGPSDVAVQYLRRHANADSLVETAIPYLQSDSPVLLRGAVATLYPGDSHLSPTLQSRAEAALFAAADHIVHTADSQTLINYAAALGTCRDDRASSVLWNLVERNAAREQALIALTWRHMPADLPRLAKFVEENDLYGLPYALRRGFGEAATPYLETTLEHTRFSRVRIQTARELLLAGRPSGFAYVMDAVENNKHDRIELIGFLRGQFPELRDADDAAVLAFLKARAHP